MANQLDMAEAQAILALHGHGWSARRIARELGVNRETVGCYIQSAKAVEPADRSVAPTASGLAGIEGEGSAGSASPSPANEAPTGSGSSEGSGASVAESKPTGPAKAPPGSDGDSKPATVASEAPTGSEGEESDQKDQKGRSAAWGWRGVIIQKLEQGLDARRIYQDLVSPLSADSSEQVYTGSYYSVRRLVKKLSVNHAVPFRRMECAAGEEAQVDFGTGAPIIGADGRRKTTWVFRIVLSHSRKGYSEAVLRQTTDDFLRCLENAFMHFGGVPRTLVIDNLRAAVTRADWFDPELCPKARSFAEHYGTAILPTRPYTPRHKGKIENGIKYVKNNALKGRKFSSLAAQNEYLAQWESSVADTRIHGTTRQQVIKLFTELEKPALLALPASRFELFQEALRRVARDGHVQVKGAYYSAPPEYMGQAVWARWDGRMVRLFDGRMRPIAVHAQREPGKFSTLSAHIVPEKINGLEKGTTWLLQEVDRIGTAAKTWAEQMLAHRGIEGVRVLMGLLSLSNRHERGQIERACEVAVGHGAYHLRSLRQLIEQAKAGRPTPVQRSFEFITEHPIIRPVSDYGQFVRDALSGFASSAGALSGLSGCSFNEKEGVAFPKECVS